MSVKLNDNLMNDSTSTGVKQESSKTRQAAFGDLVHHVVNKRLNFERDLEIVITEQLKSQVNLTEKQQKELLKNRETFWQ